MNDDQYWIQEALKEASKSEPDVPVGCIIVLDGEEIGRGSNQRERQTDPVGHAEIVAIRQAAANLSNWRLLGATLYVTLEPCPMCAEAMMQSRIKRLVFGAYDPAAGAAGSVFNLFVDRRNLPTPEVVGGVEEETCKHLLVDFFKRQRALKKGTP